MKQTTNPNQAFIHGLPWVLEYTEEQPSGEFLTVQEYYATEEEAEEAAEWVPLPTTPVVFRSAEPKPLTV